MSTRLTDVVIDAADPLALARFWAELLDWRVSRVDLPEVDVTPPPDDGSVFDLCFVRVAEPKTSKNRLHLDLASAAPDQQMVLVERALALGAERVDVGQRNVPWIVLADPEGNEFCVLEPRPEYADTGAVAAIVVDAVSPVVLAEFWSAAIGWEPARKAALRAPNGRGARLEFIHTGEPHEGKNRVHLDVAPAATDDHMAEVATLLDLGATKADMGQGEVSWVVLADPESNEFCVLTPRDNG
jgi:predicted enzyme related to lactoylglutathione lyase